MNDRPTFYPIKPMFVVPIIIIGAFALWYVEGWVSDIILDPDNMHAARLWVQSWFQRPVP